MRDSSSVAELARRLAGHAEAVCRHYLSSGRRQGRYWLVGDTGNAPGRSLYVRLHGPATGRGAAGHWTDAATGEHGDLLDLIAASRRLPTLADAAREARRFLGMQALLPAPGRGAPAPPGSPEAARRLFAMARPVQGTPAEAYLRSRGIEPPPGAATLRFHPRCYYRRHEGDRSGTEREAWPALLAAVTDSCGTLTGVHRTWLDPSGQGKAPVPTPRRALGHLLGNAVRFGPSCDGVWPGGVLVAGEGIETVLSLRGVLPGLLLVAALSAGHLAALDLPPALRRLYVARDGDRAGQWAAERLARRAEEAGVEALVLVPALGDFNDDLRAFGTEALAAGIREQLAPEDAECCRAQSQ